MNDTPARMGAAGRVAKAFLHSRITPLLIIASVGLGVLSLFTLPREEEPQIQVPMVDIKLAWPGQPVEPDDHVGEAKGGVLFPAGHIGSEVEVLATKLPVGLGTGHRVCGPEDHRNDDQHHYHGAAPALPAHGRESHRRGRGGTRTPTSLRSQEPESCASAKFRHSPERTKSYHAVRFAEPAGLVH